MPSRIFAITSQTELKKAQPNVRPFHPQSEALTLEPATVKENPNRYPKSDYCALEWKQNKKTPST
jgi:hypothetical protein